MSNEQRRAFANLVLLCHEHHVVTDDVEKYPVDRLDVMKQEHEAKYSGALEKLQADIIDEMDADEPQPATSLERYNRVLDCRINAKELSELLKETNAILQILRKVPERTRQFFAKALRRSTEDDWSSDDRRVELHELRNALAVDDEEIFEHVTTLTKYGFADGEHDESDGVTYMMIHALGEGPWEFWSDMLAFCEAADHRIEEIVVGLNFSILD